MLLAIFTKETKFWNSLVPNILVIFVLVTTLGNYQTAAYKNPIFQRSHLVFFWLSSLWIRQQWNPTRSCYSWKRMQDYPESGKDWGTYSIMSMLNETKCYLCMENETLWFSGSPGSQGTRSHGALWLLSDIWCVACLHACSATLSPTSPQSKYCSSPLTVSVLGARWWTVAGLPWLPRHLEMASLQTVCCGTHLH